MTADLLREAARLMRERAEVATPGPWTCYGDHLVWPSEKGPAANDPILAMVGPDHDDCAEHIASWHPAVALAIADWLDVAAETPNYSRERHAKRNIDAALAVARAYLGGEAADS